MSPLGASNYRPATHAGSPTPPGSELPLQPVVHLAVGEVNPYGVQGEMPFIQSVGVPIAVNVPKGVYGVRIGDVQLAAQARTVKHRPNGNARILRVEGVWPGELTGPQTISLTGLPPEVTPEVTVTMSGGSLELRRNGAVAHTVTPYAQTHTISGSKPSNLKGSNSSASYIPSISFHEWHISRSGSATSVGAAFQTLTVEEDTPLLRCYLARGRGLTNGLYEFQMRLIVYKYRPWVRWEFTTFKHFEVNTPGAPSSPSSMAALSQERLTFTPSSPFDNVQIKSSIGSDLSAESNPFGEVGGDFTSSHTDKELNAVRLSGPEPLSLSVCDLMSYGPSAIRASTASLIIDFWGAHTGEALDFRGTGAAGEVQADSSDYNASPRGTARTWEGFMVLGNNLGLVYQAGIKDDLWFMTPAAMEASQAWGPLKASVGSVRASWFKRVNALERTGELAAERHRHFGYAQFGLVPSVIPNGVDTSLDRYVAREPMHSGRYGQSKDSYGATGDIVSGLITGDRARTLRALRGALIQADINGHHGMLFGVNYMPTNSRDGVHRRYRDPWTGHSGDSQYFYPESQYTAYWAGGARRHVERAGLIVENLGRRGSIPYTHGIWAYAMKYQHTNDPADLTKLNTRISADVSANMSSSDYDTVPAQFANKPVGCMWGNFRYGHNVVPMVIELYEATGNIQHLNDLAAVYSYMDWAPSTPWDNDGSMNSYGQYTTPFYGLAYLRLRGFSQAQVSAGAMTSMQYWIGNYIIAGTMRNHNVALPAGDPDTYTWSQVLTYLTSGSTTEEGAGFQRRFGPMIASWFT